MKCRLKRLGRKLFSLGLAIALIVTITPINLLAQVGPDVHFQLNKAYYQVGEAPVYSITGAAPNSQIYISSVKNGISTGEVDVWYGHMTDGLGNATFSGGAWQSSDAGVWSKIVKVAGRQTPFIFAVGSIPETMPPIPDVAITISSPQVEAGSGRQYVDVNLFRFLPGQVNFATRLYFTNETIPQISEGVLLGTNFLPVCCDTEQTQEVQGQGAHQWGRTLDMGYIPQALGAAQVRARLCLTSMFP